MIRACEKTGVAIAQLETIVDEIEAELQQRALREVPTSEIGELVLQNLQSLSEVAYIRFASVYRKFQGIRDFVDTLEHLQGHLQIPHTGPQTTGSQSTATQESGSPDAAGAANSQQSGEKHLTNGDSPQPQTSHSILLP
jgi:transcriptional repressor NrdR